MNYDTEVFVGLVLKMRVLQQQFFDGKRSVLPEAKKAEVLVDKFINKVLSDAETTKDEFLRRPGTVEQTGLF